MYINFNSQDSTGLTEVLRSAVKQIGNDKDMRQKCNEMANLFLTHRQVQKCNTKVEQTMSPKNQTLTNVKFLQLCLKN